MITTLNSTLIYVFSFFTVSISYQFTKYVITKWIGLDSTLFLHCVLVHNVEEWDRIWILLIYTAGPTSSFFIAFLAFFGIYRTPSNEALFRLLCIWLVTIAFSFMVGEWLSAPFFYEGFRVVLEWYYIIPEVQIALAFLFGPTLILMGIFLADHVIKLSNTGKWLQTKQLRLQFMVKNLLIPFLIGTALIVVMLVPFPGGLKQVFVNIVAVGFVVIVMMIWGYSDRFMNVSKNSDIAEFNFITIGVLLVAFIAVYTALYRGIGYLSWN